MSVRTQVCPHGPLLVRGADAWPDADGELHAVERPVVAVCRCEKSQRMPWCDGTHKLMPPGWDTAAPETAAPRPTRPRLATGGE
ncbi:CDGSH iron-sulfur domain-containing protein [Nocardioides sp. Y6]|uniref:CDGSH iron-sulfur domain-containing protein n=1 Tax=Nocardioides malaquae TaxID=2773426 RepID=A0ABR9RX35_9ACTN|nr:CDGSH iron-sulfur domain-containing protein [Nocardioides malaquae]MBE7325727.1 CDGSH iron-sulfur domain-containing protein [Nocardioides malaquae]